MKTRALLLNLAIMITYIATAQLSENKITPNIPEQYNAFGTTVCIDGNYAYVANTLYEEPSGGRVRIFHWTNNNWLQVDQVNEDGTCGYGYNVSYTFGHSIAASGDYLIVGAPAWDSDCQGNIGPDGSAFIYKRDGDQWQLEQHLADPNFHVTESFGNSVDIDGEWVISGAPQKNLTDDWDQEGAAFMYHLDQATGNWNLEQMVFASDNQPEDKFGGSVAIEGNWAIIGAKKEDEAGDRAGAAYVFHYDGNQWVETQKLFASDADPLSYFGTEVAISGDHALIGSGDGKAYVFQLAGDNWIEHQILANEGDNNFGEKLDISDDFIVIGDENHWVWGQNLGIAYLYKLNGENWELEEELLASDGEGGDAFGCSVSISGGKAIIGAKANDENFTNSGAAYVFSGYSEEPSLNAGFTISPMIVAATVPVSFFDESTAELTEINSWSWDFDNDGIEDSNEPNPEHQYGVAGTYPVTLTVSDGEISDSETKVVTVLSASSDTCIAYIPFNGLEENHQGTPAWNTDGSGPEPLAIGHELPSPPASIEVAYYYMASRDYNTIDPESTSGMSGNGAAANWPELSQALADYGKSTEDIEISFGLMSLGDDIEGVDWWLVNNVETRIYQGGTYHIRLNGEDMLSGDMPNFTMQIIYRLFMGEEDIISGETGYDLPEDVSANSSDAAQAIAQAFLNDCANEPVRFMFSSVQSANQFEFAGNGRFGGFFEVQQGFILKSCGCDLTVEAGEDIWLNPNEEAFITAFAQNGEQPYEYQWTPEEGLSDPNTSSPMVSIDETTTYTVTVTDASGCEAVDSLTVNIANLGRIIGYVTDINTGDSLNDALLELSGPMESTTVTTFDGYYEFNHLIPSEEYKIICSREAYPSDSAMNISVVEFEATQVNFQLGLQQSLELNAGYNFVSSYFIPEEPDMLVVLEELLDEELEFVRNGNGDVLQKIGPNWVNGIGNWNTTEGYIFNMNEAAVFGMHGDIIDPFTPIELEAGYQFVSYLPTEATDALQAFSGILGDNLHFIRNDEGNVIQKIGPEWINGIGNAEPGEGYLVKMQAQGTLIYQNGLKSAKIATKPTEYIDFTGGNPAEPVFTLYIEPGKALEMKDEIAVFDGDKMVGAARIQGKSWKDNPVAVYKELLHEEGYSTGNPIIIKKYENGNYIKVDFELKEIYEAHNQSTYPKGDGKYGIVEINEKSAGVIEQQSLDIRVYPNPSSSRIQIQSQHEIKEITIISQQGQSIRKLNPYQSKISVNINDWSKGVYYIQITGDQYSVTRKFLVN